MRLCAKFYGHDEQVLDFVADSSMPFSEALREPVEENIGDISALADLELVLCFTEQSDFGLYFLVGRDDTVNDVYRLFGDELSASPPTVTVLRTGFGGGDVMHLFTVAQALVQVSLDVVGVAGIILGGLKLERRVRHKKSRAAAAEWAASGHPSDELLELVQANPDWEIGEFKAQFGTNDFRSAELLRLAGYKYVPQMAGGPGMWFRDAG